MKNITEIVFLLDASGSMYGLEKDTIGGFNGFIQRQKREEGEAVVSLILFNHRRKVLLNRKDLKDVRELREEEYTAAGSTALLDAVGYEILHIEQVHRLLGDERPNRTIFVITTDGYENSSMEFTYRDIHRMIDDRKREDWEFLFLGANIDAAEIGSRFGIDRNRTANYIQDEEGIDLNFEVLASAVSEFRNLGEIREDWSAEIDKNYEEKK